MLLAVALAAWYGYSNGGKPSSTADGDALTRSARLSIAAAAERPPAVEAATIAQATTPAATGRAPVSAPPPTAAEPTRSMAAADAPSASGPSARTPPAAAQGKRKRSTAAKPTNTLPPMPAATEPPMVVADAASAAPAPTPEAPAPLPGPAACAGLKGLRLQQCLACDGIGVLRKYDCELRVQTSFCRAQWGNSPDCPKDLLNERPVGN